MLRDPKIAQPSFLCLELGKEPLQKEKRKRDPQSPKADAQTSSLSLARDCSFSKTFQKRFSIKDLTCVLFTFVLFRLKRTVNTAIAGINIAGIKINGNSAFAPLISTLLTVNAVCGGFAESVTTART